ncbi:hypothetical protein SODALDRAFT_363770 [Sodiomyces alkalinus F11]|uniref:Uncharacterized protein n=1 Tax=Sodiomyces alkalinus (strain CBS 110278 / VKM F-3762 / F11) TaxID=1314773 RepID=A0A3N2PKN4_SODAK|nr:hypothetical protein SODALDRAFT_363770 [Sodiomyces alkalinus F11]ROT35077.1 hypothetical protein SODALDRAFT_363770 [Sodiomyces alkalinus F11]
MADLTQPPGSISITTFSFWTTCDLHYAYPSLYRHIGRYLITSTTTGYGQEELSEPSVDCFIARLQDKTVQHSIPGLGGPMTPPALRTLRGSSIPGIGDLVAPMNMNRFMPFLSALPDLSAMSSSNSPPPFYFIYSTCLQRSILYDATLGHAAAGVCWQGSPCTGLPDA